MKATQKEIDAISWRRTDYIQPHEYFMRKDYPDLYNKLAADIDASPVWQPFKGRLYQYLIFNGWRYWRFQTLINRQKIG